MKNRLYGTAAKGLAFLLFLISFLAAFWSLIAVAYMASDGYYESGHSFYKTELCDRVTQNYASTLLYEYYDLLENKSNTPPNEFILAQYEKAFNKDNTNFLFELTDQNGVVLLTNYDGKDVGMHSEYVFNKSDGTEIKQYRINCYVRDPITAADEYIQSYSIYQTLISARYTLIVLAAVSSLLTVCLFVYLMYAAGRRKNSSEIITSWQHAVPLDLLAAGLIAAGYIASGFFSRIDISWSDRYGFLTILPVSLILSALAAFALMLCMNLAVRIKKGKWWRNTVIYRILSKLLDIVKKLFQMLPMIWKAAVLMGGYLFVNCIMIAVYFRAGSGVAILIWLTFNLAVFAALCFLLRQAKTLKRAGAQIAEGDYSGRIDTAGLVWDLKQHAENLNNIGVGMSKAVDARMKSERLKTELITNVSHDLKTPLTSIISYIDLLKKEKSMNEKVEEYITVLDRQSYRLKKLTEDLLEASKAATGNISVSLGETDLVELANQSAGEYAERFAAGNLEAVFRSNSEKVLIYADGKLLWRVFDNLLNNISKYALPGTRVYMSIDACDTTAKISFLNISSNPLNIDANELLERFVRGDASRSTEGSGLGMSIAKSLTELQNGSFELFIDGDLFKTVITFNTLK